MRKESRKYPTISNEEEIIINPRTTMWLVCCCDCGLVHEYDYKITNKKHISMRITRMDRRTAQVRRHENTNLQTKNKSKYKMIRKKI